MNHKRPWVPLLTDSPPSFRCRSVMARGVWVEMYRALDHSASPLGELEPWRAVARLIGAPPSERRPLKKAVEELLEGGDLVIESGKIRLNFTAEHPTYRGPKRQTNDKRATNKRQTNDKRATDDPSKCAKSLGPNYRIEENRIEESTPKPPEGAVGGWSSTKRTLVSGYQTRYESAKGVPWSLGRNLRHVADVVRWLESFEASEADIEAWLSKWFADSWAAENGWPWSAVAKNPGRYWPTKRKPQSAKTKLDKLYEQKRSAELRNDFKLRDKINRLIEAEADQLFRERSAS